MSKVYKHAFLYLSWDCKIEVLERRNACVTTKVSYKINLEEIIICSSRPVFRTNDHFLRFKKKKRIFRLKNLEQS